MRKWQSLKAPKEGGRNLRLRVSSQSRSRGSSQNSPQKRSDKGSQRSRTSDVQQKNLDNAEQAPKETNDDSDKNRPQTLSNTRPTPESKKSQLAEKLSKLKRPSMLNNFQSSSKLNTTNLSNRKSIRDVAFRNGNTSAQGFGAGASSILTDNSERLRENLESIRKSKSIRQARDQQKQQSDPRKKYRAQPIKDSEK